MFQTATARPSAQRRADPEFSPYHRQAFEFLKLREKYSP